MSKSMKFKSPIRLGDAVVVNYESSSTRFVNQLNRTEVFVAKRAILSDTPGYHFEETTPLQPHAGSKTYVSECVLYADELQHGGRESYMLPTRTVFNLFERGRTDALGGPARLAALTSSGGANKLVHL